MKPSFFCFFLDQGAAAACCPRPFIPCLFPRQPGVVTTVEHPLQSDPPEVRLKLRLPTRPGTPDRPTVPDFACRSTFLVFPLSVNRCVPKQVRRQCPVLGPEMVTGTISSLEVSRLLPRSSGNNDFQTRPRPRSSPSCSY